MSSMQALLYGRYVLFFPPPESVPFNEVIWVACNFSMDSICFTEFVRDCTRNTPTGANYHVSAVTLWRPVHI